jgi:hypothetical protein
VRVNCMCCGQLQHCRATDTGALRTTACSCMLFYGTFSSKLWGHALSVEAKEREREACTLRSIKAVLAHCCKRV